MSKQVDANKKVQTIGSKTAVAKVTTAARTQRIKNSRAGNALSGFMEFVRTQGVVGLAVGLAIGTQAGATVKTIVEGFINPIVGFVVGGVSLEKLQWHTGLKNNGTELVFGWGAIVSATITLLAVAAVIYFVVMGLKLDKLDKKKD